MVGAMLRYTLRLPVPAPYRLRDMADVQALGIALLDRKRRPGEVDDAVGEDGRDDLAAQAVAFAKSGHEVIIVSSDKDFAQIVGDKIRIIKHRRRKHYHKEQGHRQNFTEVKILGIVGA